MSRLRNRRGVTLVLVAMLILALVGIAAIAIDFSRAFMYKNELQTTADAAAMAAAMQIAKGQKYTATDTALVYDTRNLVEGAVPAMTAEDVVPGVYTDNGGFISTTWGNPAVNAVKVTARHTANYTLGRVFGQDNLGLSATAIGALGYASVSDCLRPWAVSYQTMLDKLYPPAGSKDPSYDLTGQDIQTLTNMSSPANEIRLLAGSSDPYTPGNIAQVVVNDPWNGNNSYKAAISGGCSNLPIGPGTWLNGEAGVGSGQTKNALKDFCDANGGTTGGATNFTCNGHPKVKLAMWDIHNGAPGSNLQFRVKYVGVFAIVAFKAGTGKGQPPDQITGYFSSMAVTGGGFTSTPTPLTGKVALVQ